MSGYLSITTIFFALSVFIYNITFAQEKQNPQTSINKKTETKYKVTFIELGSVRCIPCKKMQPVIKSIEEKYSKQVNVIFYDVWTAEGKEKSKQFVFNEIPTQLFIDKEGKEYFRHVGFFSEQEVIKMLQQKGVK